MIQQSFCVETILGITPPNCPAPKATTKPAPAFVTATSFSSNGFDPTRRYSKLRRTRADPSEAHHKTLPMDAGTTTTIDVFTSPVLVVDERFANLIYDDFGDCSYSSHSRGGKKGFAAFDSDRPTATNLSAMLQLRPTVLVVVTLLIVLGLLVTSVAVMFCFCRRWRRNLL